MKNSTYFYEVTRYVRSGIHRCEYHLFTSKVQRDAWWDRQDFSSDWMPPQVDDRWWHQSVLNDYEQVLAPDGHIIAYLIDAR